MKAGASALLLAGSLLPSWVHLPTRFERWLWNPRERTAVAIGAQARGEPEAAVRPLETAARLRPDDPLVQYNAGSGALAAGDARDAVGYLERAAAAAPPALGPAAHYNLGTARLGAGDAAGAVEALSQSLRLAPGQADAKHNLELALRELERRRGREQRPSPQGAEGEGSPEDRPGEEGGEPRPEEGRQGENGSQGSQPGPAQPQGEPQTAEASGGLPRFRELPDMTAAQAAGLLEAVENLERQQRRRAAAQGQRRRAETGEDW